MTQKQRALQLVELIYTGAVDPASWQLFAERLSEEYGGGSVALSLQLPTGPALEYYHVGFVAEFADSQFLHLGNLYTIAPFYVLIVILMVKPYGLFGTADIERI